MIVLILILLFIILMLLTYISYNLDHSINVIIEFAEQIITQYKNSDQKNFSNYQSLYFKIEKLEHKILGTEEQISKLEHRLSKSINEALAIEELRSENQKLKRILKRQNRAQPPR